jgi:protein-arginine kinase activator protein McsA
MPATVLQMRTATDTEAVTCYKCGVDFASPVLSRRRTDGEEFWCPNGHGQVFHETEVQRLRKQLEAEKQKRETAEREKDWALVRQRDAESKATKVQKKLNLQTKRINAGVCPHCHRTFQQLARHMQCKHSEQVTA